jgi:hypothetical protein
LSSLDQDASERWHNPGNIFCPSFNPTKYRAARQKTLQQPDHQQNGFRLPRQAFEVDASHNFIE